MKYRHILIVGLILGLAAVVFGSHPYISDPGTLIEGFENVNDWVVYGTDATAENDASIFKFGTQSIKLNGVGGERACITKTVSLDFSAGNYFSLWFYITDKTKLDYIGIIISSTTNISTGFWRRFYSFSLQGLTGWTCVGVYKSDFKVAGGESWDNTMVRIQIKLAPNAGESVSAYIDNFSFGEEGQPKVIITFDDNHVSQIDKAYPIMAANGQAGVAFTYRNAVGGATKMTLADMQTLRDAGWDISNHGTAHPHFTEISQEAMEADVDGGYDWLVANGFGETAKFFAYPYNEYNADVITKLKERHVLARGGLYFRGHFDIVNFNDMQYELSGYGVKSTTSVATLQAKIDEIAQQGGLLILIFHKIVDVHEELGYLTADFTTISDYLKAKEDAGELEVITFSDYYNALIELNPFCLEEPAMDFNGDCRVDFADFALFTQSWLECNLDPQSACWE